MLRECGGGGGGVLIGWDGGYFDYRDSQGILRRRVSEYIERVCRALVFGLVLGLRKVAHLARTARCLSPHDRRCCRSQQTTTTMWW